MKTDPLYNQMALRKIAKETAYQTIAGMMAILKGETIFENFTEKTSHMPEGEEAGMAKYRIRVQIGTNDDGTPIFKQVQAENQNTLNDRIVIAYIESGRIWEFLQKPEIEPPKRSITFGEYVDKWMNVYKDGPLSRFSAE